jgi:opacity protein-like surface antigen
MSPVLLSSVVRSWIPGGLLVVWTVTGSGLLTTTAQAEWYVGGYGGISSPGSLSNVTVSDATLGGGVTNARINDLELKSGLLGGVKSGYFFESRPWLGIETDLYTQKPDVKQQTVVGGTSSGSVFAANMPTTSLRLTVWTVNLIIRSPSMSDVFQPYGGIGYGLFFATGSQGGQSNTQANPGFQFVAGARYVLTQEWALFGEFKYNNTEIRVSGIKGNYDSQNFVVGLMWHFGR